MPRKKKNKKLTGYLTIILLDLASKIITNKRKASTSAQKKEVLSSFKLLIDKIIS